MPNQIRNNGNVIDSGNGIAEVTAGMSNTTATPNVVMNYTNLGQSGIHNVINTTPISYINIVSTSPSKNGSANKNGGEQVGNELVNKFPSSYATKLSPTSSTKTNLPKLKVNVPTNADYDVWLPLDLVHEVNDRIKNSLYKYFISKRLAFHVVEWFVRNNWEKYGFQKVSLAKGFFKFSSIEGVDSVLRYGRWMICEIPIFLNKWSPFVSLLKEELSHVLVWVQFHNVPLVAYTSNGLSLMAMKIGNPLMLDSYTNSMCLESLERSSYVRVLIEINLCNDFSDNLVMVVLNLEGNGYT
ncbi:ribonuclease H-like domain-containing protein, partial [Tanacetum coccineum]